MTPHLSHLRTINNSTLQLVISYNKVPTTVKAENEQPFLT